VQGTIRNSAELSWTWHGSGNNGENSLMNSAISHFVAKHGMHAMWWRRFVGCNGQKNARTNFPGFCKTWSCMQFVKELVGLKPECVDGSCQRDATSGSCQLMRTVNQHRQAERGGDAVWRGSIGSRRSWSCVLVMTAWKLGIRG
jgi:hypothetical protein